MTDSQTKASSSMPQKQNNKKADINLNTNFLIITDQNDFPYILKETGKRLLVVEFFAKWCGPCQNIGTKLEDLAKSYDGKILIVKIDVDEFEELSLKYNISSIPTFIIMKNQKKLAEFSSSNIQILEKNLEKHAGKPALIKPTKMETEIAKGKNKQSIQEKKEKH